MNAKTIAITLGDPAGIGPEIALKSLAFFKKQLEAGSLRLLIMGDAETLANTARQFHLNLPPVIDKSALNGASHRLPAVAIVPTSPLLAPVRTGKIDAEYGKQAYEAVEMAVHAALAGDIAALVTAPLSKEALHLAGYHYAGHTEMLAALTGGKDSVMMLAHDTFRVSHVTTHCALADVPKKMTPERIRHVVDLTYHTLVKLGISTPRIAIAALNPHAGEGGVFGRQDIDITQPIVAAYQAMGMHIDGPVSGDTVFVKLHAGQYDAVVAMYHDQGHIPVKLLGFQVDRATGNWTSLSGVNVTLGLPIIRTSVDHGTAFDIAGTGKAQESSLVEAIDYALRLV